MLLFRECLLSHLKALNSPQVVNSPPDENPWSSRFYSLIRVATIESKHNIFTTAFNSHRYRPVASQLRLGGGKARSLVGRANLPGSTKTIAAIWAKCLAMCGDLWRSEKF